MDCKTGKASGYVASGGPSNWNLICAGSMHMAEMSRFEKEQRRFKLEVKVKIAKRKRTIKDENDMW